MDEKNLVVVHGNVHALASPESDQGLVANAQPLRRMLLLLQRGPDQEEALRQLLDDQQSKSSPNYHAWLTPAQFGQQFGPADTDIQAVTSWLSSQGFTDVKIGTGRTVIEFSGNVAQVRNSFHTEIHKYLVQGEVHLANASDPQIPAALAPVVAGLVSLNNFPVKSHLHRLGPFQKAASTGEVKPLFTFPGCQSGNCFAVGPPDFATIYNSLPLATANPKIDGTGQTIAIVGETNIDVQDVVDFRTLFGLQQNFTNSNIILNGPDPGINGSEGESDIDVQWSGAVAPGATIDFVTSAPTETTAGIFLSAVYIVDNNLASVMSESFGGCEQRIGATLNQFHNLLWEQASAQGITVLLSTGDGGSAGCDDFNSQSAATRGVAVSGFASTPFNVAVGGTDFDQAGKTTRYWKTIATSVVPPVPASALSYIPEVPWNDSCAQFGLTGCNAGNLLDIVAGSGGVSTLYSKPAWQMGVTGVPNDNHRDLPDVSLFASNGFNDSFYIMCQRDVTGTNSCNLTNFLFTFQGVGGTSVSSPAFAGIMALVNQRQATAQNPAPRQGNANYVLYALAKKPGASCNSNGTSLPAATCTFNDVTKGSISVPCSGGSSNCSSKVSGVNGVLVEPASSSTPAYPATAGYDLATGLGSVNVQNLVNNWPSVSFLGTKTVLTLNNNTPISLAHGTSVAVAISVAPSSGTGSPKGDVSLIGTYGDGKTVGLGDFTLASNGTVAGNTATLAGGNYTVTAHYTGDGTFAPSDSAGVTVTVTPELGKVLISVPMFDPNTGHETGNAPTTLVYGSPYILRADVTNAQGSLAALCTSPNCPTGTITFTDTVGGISEGAPNSGVFGLNSAGFTEDLPVNLPGGSNVITAAYSGDQSFAAPAQPTTYTLNVSPAPTQMSVPFIPFSPEIVGIPVSVSSFLITNLQRGDAPTGTITFFDGTTVIPGTVSYTSRPGQQGGLYASITGSMMANFTTSGTHAITAKYSGDPSYSTSTSSEWDATVFYPSTLTLTADSTTIDYGSSVTVTARVTSSFKTPAMTGHVAFQVNGAQLSGGPATLGTDANGNQVLTCALTLTPTGNVTVQASFAGDSNFQSSSSFMGINVNIPDFTLPQSTNLTVTAGQSQTVVINVTPSSATPSTVILTPFPSTMLPSGVTLSFNPSTVNLNGAPVPVTVTVNTAGPSGGPAVVAARRAGRGVLPRDVLLFLSAVSGLILLYLLGIPLRRKKSVAVFCSGAIFALTVALGCGGGGTGEGLGGGGGGAVQTSIALVTSSAKIPSGGLFTLTATVTSTKTVTGTVNIFQGPLGQGSGIAPPITVVNGKAIAPVTSFYSPGIYPFWANYSGDASNLPSQTTTPVSQVFTGSASANFSAQTGGLSHQGTITINLQ